MKKPNPASRNDSERSHSRNVCFKKAAQGYTMGLIAGWRLVIRLTASAPLRVLGLEGFPL